MIQAIIFDLDNCLSPSDAMGREFFAPVFDAIRNANRGAVSEKDLECAFEDMWRTPLDVVAREFHFTDEMLQAGWEVSRRLEVRGSMQGYDDLALLKNLGVPLYLVTSGFRRIQESKVRALGIADHFAGVFIDAIDEPNRQGKQGLFEQILKNGGFTPGEVLVVGDHPESEIAAGNRLGMPTAQIIRPGVQSSDSARHVIRSLAELPGILARSGSV